ncbi:MBL fold metallo-hydrolase [Novipirellula artificiosorum]|uniref:Metal-dependent hydrolase n=1 Tax=Novipirellula artificiosorum TaxID=2528016 RepID=A0A5C6DTQ5_9BACT|nr:MBL fold metallo-hydrolase [Novipirellula artificiosorum]TWU39267.1 metal-dependent hydrolase [Novipirellula artificiosorum]
MSLIPAVQKDEVLQRDFQSAVPAEGILLWWLGQSGFLIKSEYGTVLFDPYLSDSLTDKYRDTDKPHVRMTERAIKPSQLTGIDLVTSTHNHTDHLDAATLGPLIAANPSIKLVIPEANRAFVAKRLACDFAWPIGLSDGQSETVGAITIHAVPAAHNNVDRDQQGRCHYLGYIVQLGPNTIYHSGDTLMYDGMSEILRPFAVDLAILPINGMRPERRVSGNLFGDQAAQLAHQIGARMVVPCHYDMFSFNTESPDIFIDTCKMLGQPYRILGCGERFAFS